MRIRLACLLVVAGCGDNVVLDPCDGIIGACVGVPNGTSSEEIDTIFNDAQAGQIIVFGAGTFEFTTDLSLTANNITLRGAGDGHHDPVVRAADHRRAGDPGHRRRVPRGGLRDRGHQGRRPEVEGSQGVTIRSVRVEWTGGPRRDNGAYGLYPVQCERVLIEESTVIGASDAGIYVGQSQNIIVARQHAPSCNVAGIEIENSTHADVYGNTATNNTGGILVFNLPGLPVEQRRAGRACLDNEINDNNTENFAPKGNIVGHRADRHRLHGARRDEVEIFDNDITGHIAAALSVVSYIPIDDSPGDPNYDPYPTAIYAHDNLITGTANMPTGELGALLILALAEFATEPYIVPDQIWDGVVDPRGPPAGSIRRG